MKVGGRVITHALPAISHIGTATHKQTLRTDRFYPQEIPPDINFLKVSRPHCHSAAGRIVSMQSPSDFLGNRTHDLPACIAMPQPTAPPHTPQNYRDY
jgi:hypothetical protein